MKKTPLTIFFCLSIALNVFAQSSGGFKGGLNFASLRGDDAGNPTAGIAYHFGGFVNFKISEVVSIQPELLFNSLGAKESESGVDFIVKLNYVSVPVMLISSFGNFNIQAGPQLSFLTSAKLKVEYAGQSDEGDVKELFKGTDFGMNLGIGAAFGKFHTSVRYCLGLTKVYDEELAGDVNAKNSVMQLSLGGKLFGN